MSRLFNEFCICRDKRSKITLPNGTHYFPSANLPPLVIYTEELEHSPEFAPKVREHGSKMSRNMLRPNIQGITDNTETPRGAGGVASPEKPARQVWPASSSAAPSTVLNGQAMTPCQ